MITTKCSTADASRRAALPSRCRSAASARSPSSPVASAAFTLDEPKSLHGRRTIQLPKFAADALRAHRDRQEFEAKRAGDAWDNELGLVFTTELGRPLHRRNILRWFQNLLEREELPVRDLKALRHTVASLLHHQGASPRDVMEALGHSDIRITLNTYTSLFAERRRELADGMDAWRRSS
jgi:integrase